MTYTTEDLIFDITRTNKEQYDELYSDYLKLQEKHDMEVGYSELCRQTLERSVTDYYMLQESYDAVKDSYTQLTESFHPFKWNLFSAWLWGGVIGATAATIITAYITVIA